MASSQIELEQYVETVARQWRRQLAALASAADKLAQSELQQQVRTVMDEHLARLGQTGVWGESNRILGSRVWNIAGPILKVGSLQLHAREKPSGYAGDFRLLERICANDCRGTGLALAFDTYFQQHPAPHAETPQAAEAVTSST